MKTVNPLKSVSTEPVERRLEWASSRSTRPLFLPAFDLGSLASWSQFYESVILCKKIEKSSILIGVHIFIDFYNFIINMPITV
jgi:hypothetical protein